MDLNIATSKLRCNLCDLELTALQWYCFANDIKPRPYLRPLYRKV